MAVKFNGSTHKLQRDAILHGVINSAKMTVAGWIFSDSSANVSGVILAGGPSNTHRVFLAVNPSTGELAFTLRNSAGAFIYVAETTDQSLSDSTWHHFVISADMSVPTVLWRIDRTAPTLSVTTNSAGTIDFIGADRWTIGTNHDNDATGRLPGSLFDLLFKAGEFVDISDSDKLEMFISSDGRSASGDLFWQNSGPNSGKKPVGYGIDFPCFNFNKPDIYFSGSFQQNLGTGGQFIATGLPFGTPASEPDIYRHAAHYDNHERWFDSELTGFSYTRSRTFIEQREGHPKRGLRMGIDERDSAFRQERPSDTFRSLLYNDREDDTEEWDR